MRSWSRMFRFVRPYRWQALWAMLLLVGVVASDLLIPRLTQRLDRPGDRPARYAASSSPRRC